MHENTKKTSEWRQWPQKLKISQNIRRSDNSKGKVLVLFLVIFTLRCESVLAFLSSDTFILDRQTAKKTPWKYNTTLAENTNHGSKLSRKIKIFVMSFLNYGY